MADISRSNIGALIPEDVTRDIIQSAPSASVVLSRGRRVTMSRAQQRIPVLSVLPQAYFVNGDTGLKQTTTQAWTNKYLNAEEIAVIVPIAEAVLDDADYDIWGEVRPRILEAIGQTLDAAVLFGVNKPTSWPTALVPAAIAAGNSLQRGTVAGQDLAGDVSDVMAFVEEDGFDVTGFAARIGIKNALRKLRDDNGQPIYQSALTADTPAMLYGEPIQYVRNTAWVSADADLVAGDWTQIILGIRQDITWKLLTEASLYNSDGSLMFALAQQDMVAMRVVFRVAFQVANPMTASNDDDETRYPFSVLEPV